jgi:hypothetical protein
MGSVSNYGKEVKYDSVINYGEEKNNMSRCGCGGSSTTKTKKKKVMTTQKKK